MKQHILSLALLLSAPTFAMETPETDEAFIGFHTTLEKDKEENIESAKKLDSPLVLPKTNKSGNLCASPAVVPAALALPESKPFYIKTDLEKLRDSIDRNQNQNEYESDSEKGLTKENIQIYRYNKITTSIKQILIDANSMLFAWVKDPLTTPRSPELAKYAKDLDAQLNRMEAWQKQMDSFTYRKITGHDNLKTCFESMSKRIGAFTSQENFKEATDDISHPAMQFLMAGERLEQLLR